jgi:hypothetical protein
MVLFTPNYFLYPFLLCRTLTMSRFHFFLWIYTQSEGPLGWVMGLSQGLYLSTGQHKHRINTHTPNIHARSGTRTHDHRDRATEDSSCLRLLGYRDRPHETNKSNIWKKKSISYAYNYRWPEYDKIILCELILSQNNMFWRIDLLLGNDRKVNNETTSIAMQKLRK